MDDTRAKIILAAISLLEKGGPGAMTVRRIAAGAGVNTAAVNYHFGSKARLMEIVLDTTLQHVFDDWLSVMTTPGLSLYARIHCFLDMLMEGIERYPGIVRARLFDPTLMKNSRRDFARGFGIFLDRLQEMISAEGRDASGNLRLSLAQMISSAVTMALVPELLSAAVESVGTRRETRNLFISSLVSRFTGIEPELTPGDHRLMDSLFAMAFSGLEMEICREP
jgi:AcrR family transcriptional regulator